MPVSLLIKLEKRLADLRALLPASVATGLYSRLQQDEMLGYRLLAHAEIEGFLEALATLAKDAVWTAYQSSGEISVAGLLMVDYWRRARFPPKSMLELAATDEECLERAVHDLTSRIDGNNGCTEKDVLKLFLPFGIQEHELDLGWLSHMDELARRRGDVAHKSWETAISAETTPEAEVEVVDHALNGLRDMTVLIHWFLAKC